MKKIIPAIAILFMLSLAACSSQPVPSAGRDGTNDLQSESTATLDTGIWPVNDYTEGLPVPPGTVAWAALDEEHSNCSISLVDIAESDYSDYMKLLEQEGFSVIENISEDVKGQDYVSIGTLLSNGEKVLSISRIPDSLTIYISFEE